MAMWFFVIVVILAVFLRTARLDLFLRFLGGFLFRAGGHETRFDRLVFWAPVALFGYFHDTGIDHRAFLRLETPTFEITAEGLE